MFELSTTSNTRGHSKKMKIKTDFLQQKATYFSDSFNQLYLSSRKNYHDIDKRFISQKNRLQAQPTATGSRTSSYFISPFS
jgi:hypothetical protein